MSTAETTTARLLTVAEVMDVLRVSRATAYRLISSGGLPAVKVGGSLRIDRDELRAWLHLNSTTKENHTDG